MNLLKGLIQAPFKMLKGLFQGIGKIFGFKNKEKNNKEVSLKNNKKGVLEKFFGVTKNLKGNNSTKKKESKFVVTDRNGNVLNGNDNKENDKAQSNKGTQKELDDIQNQILTIDTKHGKYAINIPDKMVQDAKTFNIDLSNTENLKKKAKEFGYDLDNKSQFQKALSALGITAKKVSKEKDNENNTEDDENNTKEISLKRDRQNQQNQFFKNSFADKNEAFNSQLFANKLPSTSAGASLGTGIALGEVVNSETGKKVKGGLEKLVTSAIGNKNSTQTLEKGKKVKTK